MLLKIAAKGLALFYDIAGGLSEKNSFPGRFGRSGSFGMLEALQQAANVMCQVVQLQPEIALGLGAKDLIKLTDSSGLRIDLKEFIAEQGLELGRMHVQGYGRLKDLEDANFVVKPDAALFLSGLPEFAEFLASPFGLDVTRGDDRDERGDAPKSTDERVGKGIVTLKLGITPDLRLFAEKLGEAYLQGAMEV